MTVPVMYAAEELAARKENVNHVRDTFRLEGIEPSAELLALQDRYCAGALSTTEYQHALYQMFWESCPNKDWRPGDDPNWRPRGT